MPADFSGPIQIWGNFRIGDDPGTTLFLDPGAFKGSNRDSRLQPILNHLFLGRVIGNPGAPWHNLREARTMVLDVRDKGICHLGQRVRRGIFDNMKMVVAMLGSKI